MDFAVDELFLKVTPLHKAAADIQKELNKLQMSVSETKKKNKDKEMKKWYNFFVFPVVLLS